MLSYSQGKSTEKSLSGGKKRKIGQKKPKALKLKGGTKKLKN